MEEKLAAAVEEARAKALKDLQATEQIEAYRPTVAFAQEKEVAPKHEAAVQAANEAEKARIAAAQAQA